MDPAHKHKSSGSDLADSVEEKVLKRPRNLFTSWGPESIKKTTTQRKVKRTEISNKHRPPLQKQPFSAVRRKNLTKTKRVSRQKGAKPSSISPIREGQAQFSSIRSTPNRRQASESYVEDAIKQVEAHFSEEENSLISRLTPLKNTTSGKKTLNFGQYKENSSNFNSSQDDRNIEEKQVCEHDRLIYIYRVTKSI